MEEATDSASFSWWSGSHNRPLQSPWLQSILSDLDEKIKTIVNLIQDDGDSFTERAEMFYKRRPELLKILHDLHKSYCSLAEKYDLLRSPLPSSSSTLKLLQITNISDPETQPSPTSNGACKNLKMDQQDTDRNADEGIDCLNGKSGGGHVRADGQEEEEKILRLTVSNLIEDNRRQQAELIRRNEEKREVIKQLRAQISRLMEENRALRSCVPSYKVDPKRSESTNVSKLKALNCIGKFHD